MVDMTVTISAQGRDKIPDAIFDAAAHMLEGMTMVITDERECVEYVVSARDNFEGVFAV